MSQRATRPGPPPYGGYYASGVLFGQGFEHLHDLGAHLLKVYAERFEHAGGNTLALADQAQQEMSVPMMMIQAPALIDRQLEDLFCPRRQPDVADTSSPPAR